VVGGERLDLEVSDSDAIGIALALLAGYLAGSIPSGYWIVRAFARTDIRRHGSGNIGATNVWRTFGRAYGVPVVVLDTVKGFVPAFVFFHLVSPLAGVLAGGAAMLGHARPIFLRFERGGKMVATTGGAFLGVAPIVGGVGALVWLVIFLLTRYASLASIVAAVALPVTAAALGKPWPVIAFAGVAAGAVIALHRTNIRRLVRGTESRFTLRQRRSKPAQT
jgi:acyl phosphate:glycerol-3-phosphate acyltransferase